MKRKTLVFSIALNGYQWLYKDFIRSHQAYASRHGYDYQAVTRPFFTSLGVECCWLKLTLLSEALSAGYDNVLFVDADAYVQPNAPMVTDCLRNGKYLYLAKSYSGRFNTGVMLVANNVRLKRWLHQVIENRHRAVPASSCVGWGENGHVIEFTKQCDFVDVLDLRWNNTYDSQLNDYIRHFSFGPLRQNTVLNLTHKFFSRSTKLLARIQLLLDKWVLCGPKTDRLLKLTQQVNRYYPVFSRPDK